jgi:hypothetical protein
MVLWSLGFLVIGVLLLMLRTCTQTDEAGGVIPVIGAIIAFLVFVTGAIGTTSTILLGWRADRRQVEELKLKTKELELKLQEKAKPASDKDT